MEFLTRERSALKKWLQPLYRRTVVLTHKKHKKHTQKTLKKKYKKYVLQVLYHFLLQGILTFFLSSCCVDAAAAAPGVMVISERTATNVPVGTCFFCKQVLLPCGRFIPGRNHEWSIAIRGQTLLARGPRHIASTPSSC